MCVHLYSWLYFIPLPDKNKIAIFAFLILSDKVLPNRGENMLNILAVWGFINFLYIKIFVDLLLDDEISIIATLLISVVFSVTLFHVTGKYALNLFYINGTSRPSRVSLSEIIGKTFSEFFVSLLAYFLVSRGIVFGFSKRLNQELSSNYDGTEQLIGFLLIIAIPFFLHYAMVLYPTLIKSNPDAFKPKPSLPENNSQNIDSLPDDLFSESTKFYNLDGIPATFELNHLGLPVCAVWDSSPPREIAYSNIRDKGVEISRLEFEEMVLGEEVHNVNFDVSENGTILEVCHLLKERIDFVLNKYATLSWKDLTEQLPKDFPNNSAVFEEEIKFRFKDLGCFFFAFNNIFAKEKSTCSLIVTSSSFLSNRFLGFWLCSSLKETMGCSAKDALAYKASKDAKKLVKAFKEEYDAIEL